MPLSKIKGTVIADDAINADRIADGTVVASDLLDNTITGAKLATDINISTSGILKVDTIQDQDGNNIINESGDTITIGASGDTITVPTGASMTGQNYPAFQAYLSSDQTITELADVKIQFDTEVFDTNNCYDNATNYRFTPTVAGKYLVYTYMRLQTGADSDMRNTLAMVFKNGSRINFFGTNYRTGYCRIAFCGGSMVVDMNGSTDYLEIYAFGDTVSNNNPVVDGGSADHAIFGAYRIGA